MNVYEEDLDMGVDESAMCEECLDAAEDEGWMGIGGDMDDLLLEMGHVNHSSVSSDEIIKWMICCSNRLIFYRRRYRYVNRYVR
jgi:hypothetical protein